MIMFSYGVLVYVCSAILLGGSFVSSYCPPEKIYSVTHCHFRVHCHGNIRNIHLPRVCHNETVNVDLTLTEAIERNDEKIPEQSILKSVVQFQINTQWKHTTLSILEYMPNLQCFYLTDNKIENIDGSPFYTLTNLRIIDLSNNKLSDIDDLLTFKDPAVKMEKLKLAHNDIESVDTDTFSDLASLVDLDLSFNKLSNLSTEPFNSLPNLQILRLNDNNIKDLNGAIHLLVNLKHLYLQNNNLTNIDEKSLAVIHNLEIFDVSKNLLQNSKSDFFSRKIFSHDAIFKIILSGNHIKTLPNTTVNYDMVRWSHKVVKRNEITMMTDLDLSKNEISNIDYNAFHTIIYLRSLDLSSNKLIHFMVNDTDLMHIHILNLNNNYFTNLYYEMFSPMQQLHTLDMSNNRLEYIPDETFTKNSNLKRVDLSFNNISKVKNLHIRLFQYEGGVLDLSHNSLTRLDIPIDEALRLTVLLLNSNKITNAENINIYYQTSLKALDMSRNHIQQLGKDSLRIHNSLQHLDLSLNEINEIEPSSFRRLHHLKVLRLSHNRMSSINYGVFENLGELIELDLTGNQLRYIDSKVLTDLKSLKKLSIKYNEMHYIEYGGWRNHKHDIKVFMNGNNFTCDWVTSAIKDFENGYSKMKLMVGDTRYEQHKKESKAFVEGIPCTADTPKQLLREAKDDRLLFTGLKILEAIKNQTLYLKNYLWLNSNSFVKKRHVHG